jgi:predicted enzyme related to lactoylglutathione lyase
MFTLKDKYVAAGSPPQEEGSRSYWTTYLASDDADATAAKIRDAGGTLLREPFDVFDSGRMLVAQDPTGAVFAVWQAREHIGAQLANEPGSLTWNECRTPDAGAAEAFYRAVFGYGVTPMPMGGPEPYRILEVDGRGVAGMAELSGEMAGIPAHWGVVFAVDDADAAAARAEELGARVVIPPTDIPEIGRFAALEDPVGAGFQVIRNAGTPPAP